MKEQYLEQVYAIEQASFKNPWPKSAFTSELSHSWSRFLIAGQAHSSNPNEIEKVLGFVICWMFSGVGTDYGGDLHLLNIAVDPAVRRRNIGKILLQKVIDDFAAVGGGRVSLEVRPSNSVAINLYHSMGFSIVGRRPEYYQKDREDALIMTKPVERLQENNR
jgi:ribosomal-protein-alanine N-acetyltransferase